MDEFTGYTVSNAKEEGCPLRYGNRATRLAFGSAGIALLGCAAVGVLVPGWPVTIFCILALYCFKRSSAQLENWLLNNRYVGSTLRDWDENKWMTLRAKKIAIATIWAGILVSNLFLASRGRFVGVGILFAVAALLTWYLLSRRTKPANA